MSEFLIVFTNEKKFFIFLKIFLGFFIQIGKYSKYVIFSFLKNESSKSYVNILNLELSQYLSFNNFISFFNISSSQRF
jgi:hypothetical protein